MESAEDVLRLADTDGDGRVTFDEFTKLMKTLKKNERRRQQNRKGHRAETKCVWLLDCELWSEWKRKQFPSCKVRLDFVMMYFFSLPRLGHSQVD